MKGIVIESPGSLDEVSDKTDSSAFAETKEKGG
jgi:hypothetical protein